MMDDFPNLSRKERLILEALISHGELYGLQLVNMSNGQLKRGTVYVTLGRMADKGYVDSREVERPSGEGGLPLRVYFATGLGERTYQALDLARASVAGAVA